MPNGISNDLDFEAQIKDFPPESQFLARRIYNIEKNCPACQNNMPSRKSIIGTGGISGLIGGAIIAVIEYFANRVSRGG